MTRASSTSSVDEDCGADTRASTVFSSSPPPKTAASEQIQTLDKELSELFSENVSAKIWRVAERLLKELNNDMSDYPEIVPQSGPTAGKYKLREVDFWTCGFFPGSIYALLERSVKYPQYLNIPASQRPEFQKQLLSMARTWAEPLYAMQTRTDTHDMGFIIQPALQKDWELTGNARSLEAVLNAALSLASRFDERVGAIRSWDAALNHRYSYTNKNVDFLVIIDSMCNLDLLYWAGHYTSNQRLIDVATTHAHTVLRTIVRDDFSTYHLINFNPQTGLVKDSLTNQGYADWSTWSRGQAWAILGFSQTYTWTKDPVFLEAARSLADYFLSRLDASTYDHPYVPLWDFDAPISSNPDGKVLRDTSAGMIAANGLLILQQATRSHKSSSRYLAAAIRIAKETIALSLADDKATFLKPDSANGTLGVGAEEGSFDAILKNATGNAHEHSFLRYWDHGLVYADYYFLEFGNKLMRMGLV